MPVHFKKFAIALVGVALLVATVLYLNDLLGLQREQLVTVSISPDHMYSCRVVDDDHNKYISTCRVTVYQASIKTREFDDLCRKLNAPRPGPYGWDETHSRPH